jgi:hypothetical protein
MAEAKSYDLDRWGHIVSTILDNGAAAGVMTGPGGVGRLVYTRNGDPGTGYDRVWWYENPEAAIEFLRRWGGMSKPEGFIRDLQADPIDWRAETG